MTMSVDVVANRPSTNCLRTCASGETRPSRRTGLVRSLRSRETIRLSRVKVDADCHALRRRLWLVTGRSAGRRAPVVRCGFYSAWIGVKEIVCICMRCWFVLVRGERETASSALCVAVVTRPAWAAVACATAWCTTAWRLRTTATIERLPYCSRATGQGRISTIRWREAGHDRPPRGVDESVARKCSQTTTAATATATATAKATATATAVLHSEAPEPCKTCHHAKVEWPL